MIQSPPHALENTRFLYFQAIVWDHVVLDEGRIPLFICQIIEVTYLYIELFYLLDNVIVTINMNIF